jgi:hypothetical protein
MKPIYRTLTFGALSGIVWSIIPGLLTDLFSSVGESVTIFLAGAITGIAVSFSIRRLLDGNSKQFAILVGCLTLPYGAFLFGLITAFLHIIISEAGGPTYKFAQQDIEPFGEAAAYAIYSCISIFALVLFPLAIGTTLLFRSREINNPKEA